MTKVPNGYRLVPPNSPRHNQMMVLLDGQWDRLIILEGPTHDLCKFCEPISMNKFSSEVSKTVPNGYYQMTEGMILKEGDMYWSNTGWFKASIFGGRVQTGMLFSRPMANSNPTVIIPPKNPAKWMLCATPISYLLITPFTGEDETVAMFAMNEAEDALDAFRKLTGTESPQLYIMYYDHSTDTFDKQLVAYYNGTNKLVDPWCLIEPPKIPTSPPKKV